MAYYLGPISDARAQFFTNQGAVLNGGLLYSYAATSSTPQNTYTDSGGGTANANPIVLDSAGRTPSGVYLTGGLSYKFVLKDSAGNTLWTQDVIGGINDVTASIDEWVPSNLTPTYVSATSFTLSGDQTSSFTKGRRLKSTNSGGTVYSTIVNSAFGATTTVTVANDSGSLDSGLSAVSLGIIRSVNPSISADEIYRKGTAVASATTTNIWSIVGDYVHITGTTTITSLGTAPYAGDERTVIFDGALTLTHDATTLQLPGGANITTAAGDRAVVRADTTANMIVTSYFRTANQPVQDASSSVKGVIQIAAQSDMETASSTTLAVTPGRQQFHPSACKGWVKSDFAGAASASYNVSSIGDQGVGDVLVNWTTSFSSANYCVVATVVGTPAGTSASTLIAQIKNTMAVGSVEVFSLRMSDFGGADGSFMMVAAFGDQ